MNHSFEIIPLTIEARGEVIASNVDEVREMVRAALCNINRDLNTDEEFGQAELDVKALKGAEDRFAEAKEKALKDAEALHELFAAIDATVEEIRKPRLELEKLIAKRKEEVKADLIAEAMGKLECASRLRQSAFGKSVAEAIKGKRTLDSMRKALDVTVTVHNGTIRKNRAAIESFAKAHGEDLVMDGEDLEVKSPDSVEAELRRRFEAKKATEDKKRLELEAAAAREAEAKAKAEAEAAKQPVKPAPLPEPPKIGGIPTGSKAAAPGQSNVVPFAPSPEVPAITADEEWTQMEATVKAAFGLIKEHRERLVHDANKDRIAAFGAGVNALWKELNAKEVAS